MLLDKINADLKTAMLARDAETKTLLQGLKATIKYAEIDAGAELDDQAIEKVIQKEAKKRKESAGLFRKGGNEASAQTEDNEYESLQAYLPEQVSEEEVAKAVAAAIEKTGASSIKDMGKVVGMVKGQFGNTADGSLVARLIKEKLA